MTLVCTDEPMAWIVYIWIWVIRDGFERETLLGVCGYCLLNFGECYLEAFEFLPFQLMGC